MSSNPLARIGLALLTVALLAGPAFAQVSYDLGGKVSADFGVAIDGTIPVAAAALQLKLSGEVGSGFFPDASFMAELFTSYDVAAETPLDVRLGRAYATAYLGDWDLSVGNIVVPWGSVDVVNPVDVINPRDLSYPVSDPLNQRQATPLIRATLHSPEGVTVDAVLVPVFVPSTVPGPRWQPTATVPGELPPGVTVVGVANPIDNRPAIELGNMQFGMRATMDVDVGGGADASLVVYRGFRHMPTASIALVPTATPGAFLVQPTLDYDRITVLGGDFSAVFGAYVLRGEAAYSFGEDPTGADPAVGNNTFDLVLGAETNIAGGPFVTLQATYQHVAADAGGTSSNAYATVLAAKFDPDNRIDLDFAWLHDWSDGGGVVRPSISYTFADGLVGTAEAAIIYGGEGSVYGAWHDNSQLRIGVAFAF